MLKHALTPKLEPDIELNRNIVSKLKEDMPMKKIKQKKFISYY